MNRGYRLTRRGQRVLAALDAAFTMALCAALGVAGGLLVAAVYGWL